MRGNDRAQDRLSPTGPNLLLVIEGQVLHYMPGRDLQDFYELMLKDKHPASHEIELEDHLIRHAMHILCVYLKCAIEYPLRKGYDLGLLIEEGILVILERGYIGVSLPFAEGRVLVTVLVFLHVVQRFINGYCVRFPVAFDLLDILVIRGQLLFLLCVIRLLLVSTSTDIDVLEHPREVAFAIRAFLTWEYQPLRVRLHSMVLPHSVIKELGHILVVDRTESLMHAGHHTDVVVVD